MSSYEDSQRLLFPNFVSHNEKTALYRAVRERNLMYIKMLLESSAIARQQLNEDGVRLLYTAVQSNEPSSVELLLTAGLDVNVQDKNGKGTVLHLAVQKNRVDVALLLLDKGALVDEKDVSGNTPLQVAVSKNSMQLVELLLLHHANVLLKNNSDENVLHAALRRNCNLGMVKLLLELNPQNAKEPNEVGEYPLHYAIQYCSTSSSLLPVVRLLTQHCTNVEAEDRRGRPLLYLALQREASKIAEYLVTTLGANVNGPRQDRIPLFAAVQKCDAESMLMLLDHGARADVVNHSGDTLLHGALWKFRHFRNRSVMARIIEILIARGADVHRKNAKGRSLLHLAISEDFVDGARLLLEAGASYESELFRVAVYACEEEMLRLLLQYGADCRDVEAMMWVVENGTVNVMKVLLSRGADVNAVEETDRVSVLQRAIGFGRRSMVQCLLERGADVNLEVNGSLPLITVRDKYNWYRCDTTKSIMILLLKRIALLAAQGIYVSEKNAKVIQEDANMSGEYVSYCQELESMKSIKVCDNSPVTYFDLITKYDNVLVRYVRMPGFLTTLKSGSHRTRFTKCANLIDQSWSKGLKRMQLMEKCQGLLNDVFAYVLPYDVTVKIIEYLSIDDLQLCIR